MDEDVTEATDAELVELLELAEAGELDAHPDDVDAELEAWA